MKEFDKEDFSFVKSWTVRPAHNGWIELCEFDPKGYSGRKAYYIEFKKIERVLKEKGYKGWITWTKPYYFHIHKLLDRVGAQPYYYDGENIFYFKRVNHVHEEKRIEADSGPSGGTSSGPNSSASG